MKKLFRNASLAVIFLTAITIMSSPAYAYTSVRGYYRSNGTYVQPYVRSSPNALRIKKHRKKRTLIRETARIPQKPGK